MACFMKPSNKIMCWATKLHTGLCCNKPKYETKCNEMKCTFLNKHNVKLGTLLPP